MTTSEHEKDWVLVTHQPGAIGAADDNAYGPLADAEKLAEAGHLLADGAEPPMEFGVVPYWMALLTNLQLQPAEWSSL